MLPCHRNTSPNMTREGSLSQPSCYLRLCTYILSSPRYWMNLPVTLSILYSSCKNETVSHLKCTSFCLHAKEHLQWLESYPSPNDTLFLLKQKLLYKRLPSCTLTFLSLPNNNVYRIVKHSVTVIKDIKKTSNNFVLSWDQRSLV